MNAKTRVPIGIRLAVTCAVLIALAFGSNAGATVVRINFSGAAGSGYADLTLQTADPHDVIDAAHTPQAISGATGQFNGTKITGVRATNSATPPPGEVLPSSYSLLSIPGFGDHDGVSYDNLFYGNGSPMICLADGTPLYPFFGGLFDIMGVMFALDNGSFVDLWSFGVMQPDFLFPGQPGGLHYGLRVIEPTGAGGYVVLDLPALASASVPEPDFLWLLGAALMGLLVWRRSSEARKQIPDKA